MNYLTILAALHAIVLVSASNFDCSSQTETTCCLRPEEFCLDEARAAAKEKSLEEMDDAAWNFLLAFSLSLVNQQGVHVNTSSDEFSPLLKIGDQVFVTAEPWKRIYTLHDQATLRAMIFDTRKAIIVALSGEASQFKDCLLDQKCNSPQVQDLLVHLKSKLGFQKPVYIPGGSDNILGRALASRIPLGTFELPLVGNLSDGASSSSTCAYLCPVDESEYRYKAMPGAMERSLWMTAVAVLVMLGSWKGTFKFGG